MDAARYARTRCARIWLTCSLARIAHTESPPGCNLSCERLRCLGLQQTNGR